MRKARAWRFNAAVALASIVAVPAVAEPLSKEACGTAESERAALIASGIQDAIKKGPAWAKANLAPGKLKDVERYIALQEELLFKCGQAKLRALPAGDGEDGDGPVAAKDSSAASSAEQPPVPKRKAPPRKAPAPKSQASPTAADAAATLKPGSKPRPKPKPKVDDAYRPPKPNTAPTTE